MLKYWNSECVLDSEMHRTLTHPPLTLEQLLVKDATMSAPSSNASSNITDGEVSGGKAEDFLADHV